MSEPRPPDGDVSRNHTVLGWWTQSQIGLFVLLFVIPVALFSVMSLYQRDYVEVLWTTPVGIKMGVVGLALAAAAVPVYLTACVVFNQLFPTDARGRSFLSIVLVLAFVLLFIMPLVFVILIGPANIRIMNQMATQQNIGK